jgi:ketosteroid isomerase-like protein
MQKFINGSLVILFLLTFFAGSASAQQWSDTQKEIWKNVETYWSMYDNKNLEGFLSYVDDSYKGWEYDAEKPMSKKESEKTLKASFEKAKGSTMKSKVTPLEIWISGDFAYVDYTYTMSTTSKDGKTTNSSGRWTDILKKKGNKWVMVGDHGGEVTKK